MPVDSSSDAPPAHWASAQSKCTQSGLSPSCDNATPGLDPWTHLATTGNSKDLEWSIVTSPWVAHPKAMKVITVATFTDAEQLLLASGGVLARNQPDPASKLAPFAKGLPLPMAAISPAQDVV